MWLLILAIFAIGCTVEVDFQAPAEPSVNVTVNEEGSDAMVTRSESGGWSKSGDLKTFDTLAELSMQCNFPIAEYYTVKFGVEQDPALTSNPDITADVTWSVEGNAVRRKLSVGNGTTISGTGQAVSVKIRDSTLLGPAGTAYSVTALVSPGVRPAKLAPPFLRATFSGGTPYFIVIGPASSVDIPIPVNCGIVSADVELVNSTPGNPLAFTSVEVSQTNPAIFQAFKAYYPLVETGFVPIFPSATHLTVVNSNPVDSITVSVLFGVDG
jgi:hypothetical protein